MRRRLTALFIFAALGAAVPTAAVAGPTGKPVGGNSTLQLVMVDPADTVANHGDKVTFRVTTTATDRPFVSMRCYQGGTLVYTASAGFFAGYPWSQNFTLASSSWTGGDADCDARLYSTKDGTRTTTLATLALHVSA